MTKPLLHQVFAQNALTPDSNIPTTQPLYRIVPQGKTSYVQKLIPIVPGRITKEAHRTQVVCWEFDHIEDENPCVSREITISISSGDIKMVFTDKDFALNYLYWLKTSQEEKVRPRT